MYKISQILFVIALIVIFGLSLISYVSDERIIGEGGGRGMAPRPFLMNWLSLLILGFLVLGLAVFNFVNRKKIFNRSQETIIE